MPESKTRPLYEIAADVRRTWRRKDGTVSVYFGAVPYLDAMSNLNRMSDSYGYDDADDIVRYFLANANTYRGEDARRIKAELRAMLG